MRAPSRLALPLAFVLALGCGDEDAALPTGPDLAPAATRTVTISPSAEPVTFGPVTGPFGSTNTVSTTFTVTNGGSRVTSALAVAPLSAPFAIAADHCTGRSLATSGKNKSCTVTVTFTPTEVGTATATLRVLIAQPKTTLTVNLSGTGRSPTAAITGKVFTDPNVDGLKLAAEPGLPGVLVQLRNETGQLLASTVTTGDGDFQFSGLTAGSYQVGVTAPEGTAITTQNAQPKVVQLTSAGAVVEVGVNQYNIIGVILQLVQTAPGSFSCAPGNPIFTGGTPITLERISATNQATLIGTVTSGSDGTYGFLAPLLAEGERYRVGSFAAGSSRGFFLSAEFPATNNGQFCVQVE